MRFEAKHQYFKSLASRMGNFINITYSLALRQQSHQCYILSTSSGFCSQYQKIGKGKYVCIFMYVCTYVRMYVTTSFNQNCDMHWYIAIVRTLLLSVTIYIKNI